MFLPCLWLFQLLLFDFAFLGVWGIFSQQRARITLSWLLLLMPWIWQQRSSGLFDMNKHCRHHLAWRLDSDRSCNVGPSSHHHPSTCVLCFDFVIWELNIQWLKQWWWQLLSQPQCSPSQVSNNIWRLCQQCLETDMAVLIGGLNEDSGSLCFHQSGSDSHEGRGAEPFSLQLHQLTWSL